MGHHHHHGNPASKHILVFALCLTLGFAIIEAIFGHFAGSLALLSDAGHMFSDSLALGIAAFAAWIARRPPTSKHSYGYGRAEVIGAWLSSLLILAVAVAIIVEAIERFHAPQPVAGGIVMLIGLIGMLVNLLIAWVISHGERTLNTRAAMLHVMGDLLGSIAALISGAVIYFSHWYPIDPILSIFICILILISSVRLLRESLSVLMEGVPLHIELTEVAADIRAIDNVTTTHDLHIWTLHTGRVALSAHIEVQDPNLWTTTLKALRNMLSTQYHIDHITLQPEIVNQFVCQKEIKNPS